MKNETIEKIEKLRVKVGDKAFTKEATYGIISMNTLYRYDLVEKVVTKNRTEVTLEELIEDVNSMIGEDCWFDAQGHDYYYEQDNGKIYYVDEFTAYKLK